MNKPNQQNWRLLKYDRFIGKWKMPLIRKNTTDINDIQLISSDHIKTKANLSDIHKTVHFFVDDDKLDRYYNNPDQYVNKLAQYANVLTPDYSLYTDMPLPIQIYNTYRNRWCGAYWQQFGLSVIPTLSWSTKESFEFCFDGIEPKSVVAISTIGVLNKKILFLRGYSELIKRINPKQVICLGSRVFPEMGQEVVFFNYQILRRRK